MSVLNGKSKTQSRVPSLVCFDSYRNGSRNGNTYTSYFDRLTNSPLKVARKNHTKQSGEVESLGNFEHEDLKRVSYQQELLGPVEKTLSEPRTEPSASWNGNLATASRT